MDGNARKQAYDRGHTIFSPDGRLYQVEYAREAVSRGSTSVGVRTDDGVVLAARKRLRSPLLEAGSVEKIHRVDDHVAVASAGHAADARQLIDVARRAGQRHRLRYDEPIDVDSLTTAVADHVQEHTQSGGSRPYGSALLFAGVDGPAAAGAGPASDGVGPAAGRAGTSSRSRLVEIDPSGTPYGWRATAVGAGAAEAKAVFEERLEQDGETAADATPGAGGRQRGTRLALEALETATEDELSAADCEVWTLETGPTIDRLSSDEIETALAETAS